MGTVGLLFSISQAGVQGTGNSVSVESEAQTDAKLNNLAISMQQTLLEQGIEAGSATEIKSLIE